MYLDDILSYVENHPTLLTFMFLLLWLILRNAPDKIVNPLKKTALFLGLILLIKQMYDFNATAYEFIRESILANSIQNNFDKSEDWLKGLFDGFYLLLSAGICGKLIAMEFLSKKTKK